MQQVKKKKILKNFKNIQSNNNAFISFLSTLEKYPLEEGEKKNLDTLKEHLNNMTVLFTELSSSITTKKSQ